MTKIDQNDTKMTQNEFFDFEQNLPQVVFMERNDQSK